MNPIFKLALKRSSMRNNVRILLTFCFMLFSLSSCGGNLVLSNNKSENEYKPVQTTEIGSNQELADDENHLQIIDGCIQPYESFEYKVNPDVSKPIPGKTEIVEPDYPWEIETEIDTKALPNGLDWLRSKVLGVRSVNGETEIWVENQYADNKLSNGFHQTISIYLPTSNQWKNVDVDFGLDADDYVYISKLFFDKDGTIWGATTSRSFSEENRSTSILSKYNQKDNRFEFDPNVIKIPRRSSPPILSEPYVFFDENNNFWFVVPGDSIYLYKPVENKIKNVVSISSLDIYSVSMAPDNSIYFVTYNPENPSNPELKIYRYSILDDQFDEISTPEEIFLSSSYGNLLLDNDANLWLDSIAMREPDGEWHNIIQPTIFITNFAEDMIPRWRIPDIQTETSDERIWFTGDNGSTWLDRNNQKWCWYSTYKVVPVEDTDGILWIVVNDHLYSSKIDAN